VHGIQAFDCLGRSLPTGISSERALTIEVCCKLVVSNMSLATGIMTNPDLRRTLRLPGAAGPWNDANNQPRMVCCGIHINVVNAEITERDWDCSADQRRNAVDVSFETVGVVTRGSDVELMSDPVGAAGSGDLSPLIVAHVPDEAGCGDHVPIDLSPSRTNPTLAMLAVVCCIYSQYGGPAGVMNAA